MARTFPLSFAEKLAIRTLADGGVSHREIARKLDRSASVVWSLLQRDRRDAAAIACAEPEEDDDQAAPAEPAQPLSGQGSAYVHESDESWTRRRMEENRLQLERGIRARQALAAGSYQARRMTMF